MEEEPVYEDMAAEGSLEDSDAESQQSHGKMASLLWDLIRLLTARLPGMMIQEQMRTSSEDEEDKDRCTVLNIIMTEAYKLKQLSMTTEAVTKVVKMIREGTKTPDPSALLVDLSKTVSADIGRLVCSTWQRSKRCSMGQLPRMHLFEYRCKCEHAIAQAADEATGVSHCQFQDEMNHSSTPLYTGIPLTTFGVHY
ncbi:hypothetical protein UY3_05259 [Chelonia mydas]|uniref:Uncharacterized protein n=1 Tax=Chelonia mydas TaxID=8469 RepID=M7BPA4_CHEMY|nr:hypothetical protein UY3_05259 [Chelonia mydas]